MADQDQRNAQGSARAVAAQFLVSVSYVVKVRQRRERKGEITPGPQHSHTARKLAGLHAAIAAYAAENTDATIEELRSWLQAEHATYASAGLMWNTLDRLGLTFKKRRSVRLSRSVPMLPKPAVPGVSCSRS
jgi:transposase